MRKLRRFTVSQRYSMKSKDCTSINALFLGSGSCPDCRIPLRRNNFRVQMFEDPYIEKEVDIRKRVLRDFNKKEEDFHTLSEYNDYLEEIETIIYNLTNNIDIVNTNKRIEQYKKDNRELILKNKSKLSREECELEELLELEKQHEELRRTEMRNEEIEAKKKKLREKEALIDELMFSNANAKSILDTFAQNAKETKAEEEGAEARAAANAAKLKQFSTGIKFGQSNNMFLPVPIDEGPLFVYKSPTLISDGPKPPNDEEISNCGYIKHVRSETEQEKAGGFVSNIACLRALHDALFGLYHVSAKRPE